jgi:hypothetical protein
MGKYRKLASSTRDRGVECMLILNKGNIARNIFPQVFSPNLGTTYEL